LKKNKLRVWDAPVRVLHWLLVLAIAGAWFTSGRIGVAHEYVGYAAAAMVAARLAWGFIGNSYARFSQFVRPASFTVAYLREVMKGAAPRYLGHNPLGGWMVVALLLCVGLAAVTGWAATTDLLWGYAWPVTVHTVLAWTLVGLIALHIAGVVFTSWQHRENLVAAMLTGDKDEQA
jgi:cytochrome b